jgi:hypothetical protein
MDVPLLCVRSSGGVFVHCVLIETQKQLQLYKPPKEDLDLFVNIKKDRVGDQYTISVCDTPKLFNFKSLCNKLIKY